MDYEKAYKASLKTAAQWIKDGCTDKEKICLKCVFPELRESEDEKIRRCVLACIENAPSDCCMEVSRMEMRDWLEKQKEQKPAEWSEEDEKIRRNLMSLLVNMRGDRITEETYQKYYPWLKSLRPSWKPTEEQMQALHDGIEWDEEGIGPAPQKPFVVELPKKEDEK